MIQKAVDAATRVFFIIASGLLLLLALTLVVTAAGQVLTAAIDRAPLMSPALDSVGLVTIAVAVWDVGKFLLEEELIRRREMRSIREARQSMTKFFSIVIVVLALEGIVLIFEVKTEDVTKLIHPTAVMAVAVLALIGLGLFRKLTDDSASVQQAGRNGQKVEQQAQASGVGAGNC